MLANSEIRKRLSRNRPVKLHEIMHQIDKKMKKNHQNNDEDILILKPNTSEKVLRCRENSKIPRKSRSFDLTQSQKRKKRQRQEEERVFKFPKESVIYRSYGPLSTGPVFSIKTFCELVHIGFRE